MGRVFPAYHGPMHFTKWSLEIVDMLPQLRGLSGIWSARLFVHDVCRLIVTHPSFRRGDGSRRPSSRRRWPRTSSRSSSLPSCSWTPRRYEHFKSRQFLLFSALCPVESYRLCATCSNDWPSCMHKVWLSHLAFAAFLSFEQGTGGASARRGSVNDR